MREVILKVSDIIKAPSTMEVERVRAQCCPKGSKISREEKR